MIQSAQQLHNFLWLSPHVCVKSGKKGNCHSTRADPCNEYIKPYYIYYWVDDHPPSYMDIMRGQYVSFKKGEVEFEIKHQSGPDNERERFINGRKEMVKGLLNCFGIGRILN